MNDKLTLKQETFCQEYVKNGGNASDAYRAAYECKGMAAGSINTEAKKLMKNPPITLRIEAIRAPVIKKYEVTIESMTAKIMKAMAVYEAPHEKDPNRVADPSGLIHAAMEAAKLNGLLRKTDQPISPTFVRMDRVTINGKPNNWGVGEEPKETN